MLQTRLKRLGLIGCMALVLASGGTALTPYAYATSGTTTTQTTPFSLQNFISNPSSIAQGDIGANVNTLLQSGVNTSTISSALSGVTSATGISTGSWNNILTNLSSNNATTSAITNLVNGVASGDITSQLGSITSAIQNLGNINSVSGVTNLINSLGGSGVLNGLTTPQQTTALNTILNAATSGNLSSLATAAGVSAISQAITTAFPELATALGGISGVTAAISSLLGGGTMTSSTLSLGGACGPGGCPTCTDCHIKIPQHYLEVRVTVTTEFEKHRAWILTTFWLEHVLPALMLMAEQLTVAGIHQVEVIGTLLDAKQQLETQRLFQQLTAQAHKDYQPSEGMCTFGTTVRSLAGSQRRSDFTQTAIAERLLQRQAMSGEVVSMEGPDSDVRSRLTKFISTYCDQADDANGMVALCKTSTAAERRNIDVDYTRNIESRLTLDLDYLNSTTKDGEDVFALAANLYSHNIAPRIMPELLATDDGRIRLSAAEKLMNLRAVYAKRSVAQNSFAALTAMRSEGSPESAPYIKAAIKELGLTDPAEIEKLMGENPSYFAQMEVLTKKLYQQPNFYTELYDKPVNIDRKSAALQAIGLMQDRDLYNSLLRSEAVLSVLLETMLQKEQEKVVNAVGKLNPTGGPQ